MLRSAKMLSRRVVQRMANRWKNRGWNVARLGGDGVSRRAKLVVALAGAATAASYQYLTNTCSDMLHASTYSDEVLSGRQAPGFHNDVSNVVAETIQGLVKEHSHLAILQEHPNVVVRADWSDLRQTVPESLNQQVAIVTGGGSGHEPAHIGYVGQGMVTAAVCGDVFASPSVGSILAAIEHVATDAGVLLIVKNYTGDRLNFGIAQEQARAKGIKVDMVVVADDVAEYGGKQQRGLAGTVFVHKVAGFGAEMGLPLEALKQNLDDLVLPRIYTIGCSLQSSHTDLAVDEMELGLGIHGEPGWERLKVKRSRGAMRLMVERLIEAHKKRNADDPNASLREVALMVNNLGSTTPSELAIATRDAISVLEDEHDIKVTHAMSGDFMTSRDMHGVSLTLVNTSTYTPEENKGQADLWDFIFSFPTKASGWRPCGRINRQTEQARRVVETPEPSRVSSPKQSLKHSSYVQQPSATALSELISRVCDAVNDISGELDQLDSVTGDGDCGRTHRRGLRAVKTGITAWKSRGVDVNYIPDVLRNMASDVEAQMGGSSGAVYALLLTAWSNALDQELQAVYGNEELRQTLYARSMLRALQTNDDKRMDFLLGSGVSDRMLEATDAPILARSLRAAVLRVSALSGATVGDRTLLDVLLPFTETLEKNVVQWSMTPEFALQRALTAAREGLEKTKTMDGAAGRSAYIRGAQMNGTADPGAVAVMKALDTVSDFVKERPQLFGMDSDTWLWPRALTFSSREQRARAVEEARVQEALQAIYKKPSANTKKLTAMFNKVMSTPVVKPPEVEYRVVGEFDEKFRIINTTTIHTSSTRLPSSNGTRKYVPVQYTGNKLSFGERIIPVISPSASSTTTGSSNSSSTSNQDDQAQEEEIQTWFYARERKLDWLPDAELVNRPPPKGWLERH